MPYKKHHRIKLFILVPIVALIVIIVWFWFKYGKIPPPDNSVKFGVTFSTKYASQLGLDWPDLYLKILDDLKVKLIRLPVYWSEIEQNQGNFDLSGMEWMLDEAKKHDAKIIPVIGRRVPRWPECHTPNWTKNLPEERIQEYELEMIKKIVKTFRDHPAIKYWQVENEPFFGFFGECPKPDPNFIKKTAHLVKQLDPDRKIIITDSGELSTWVKSAEAADILGISMYRVTWNSFWGYFYYPLPPSHYSKKAEMVESLVDDVIVTELQVEPWVPATILTTPLTEQFHSMNIKRMRNNIDYSRRTGFSEVYLWGVEWWYWLKQFHNVDSMWEEGKKVF